MRLAYAIGRTELGGAELHALGLARGMAARGHEVAVLLRPGADALAARAPGEVVVVRDAADAARALERLRPDVLQHFDSILFVVALELAARRPRVVELIHANRTPRPLPDDFTDRVVAVSSSAARGYGPGGARVLWSGVPLEVPRASSARTPPLAIVAVGRLDGSKDELAALDACASLSGIDWTLRWWGEGPRRAALLERAEARGVASRVSLPGFGTPDYASAALFLSASPSEGFGLAIAEAAAAGLPIVARRAGGVTERLTDGVDALLCDGGGELGAQLHRAARDAALRSSLGGAARAFAEAALDVERMASEYEALYRELIA